MDDLAYPLAETGEQLVSRYIRGMRQQIQVVLNLFYLYSVSEANQRAI